MQKLLTKTLHTSAKMATLPSPPFIKIEGISNFRDIGGTLTQDGKKIKRGLVFRSADPSKPTDDGRKKMSEELGMSPLQLSIS